MLKNIFGNKTAEKVLIYIYHYNEGYPRALAKDLNIPITPVRNQLDRFEKAGVLVSKQFGRVRLYKFNERSPLTRPVKELIKIVYESYPLSERAQMFKARRRSRAKGKPVL